MGNYTGLRMKVYVKPEYRDLIKKVHEYDMEDWEDFVPEYPFLAAFAHKDRNTFIPHGSICYMPESWASWDDDTHVKTIHNGFEHSFNEKTGYWTFTCSLKNYEGEIGIFLESVASQIVQPLMPQYIEVLYEEWTSGKLYEIDTNGEIGIVGYKDYEEDF
ncbi:hypothetical protein FP76_gp186 [Bacillus phage Evoli]|uniref:Uncharacterized protein n=1 Tax=Bacillus phage Evoli TaxID=1486658 RepID=A0A024B1N6_9CAUD|nr:hypothetical protein FP76_gp186 [Bacillus phage Evoli]AHZ09908.1 hypothetical protein [Bacillus phage Evoli]